MPSHRRAAIRTPRFAMRAAALAFAVALGFLPLLGIPRAAQAAAPSYDPIAGASTFSSAVYASVVADGLGMHHAVARADGLAQAIIYRRSADGGRTWPVVGRFQGDDGGGTRPSLAVSGSNVAIAFIGRFCRDGLCGEAPYLVTSSDGGSSWAGPVRLDGMAFNVSVGVDGSRVWVAWEGRDAGGAPAVWIRGTDDGARSFFRTANDRGYQPRVTAGDGVGAITYTAEAWDPATGRTFSNAVLMIRGTTAVAG